MQNNFKKFLNNEKLHLVFYIVGALSFVIILLLIGVFMYFFNPLFINGMFTKYGVQEDLGISTADLHALTNNIVGFFAQLKSSLQTEVFIDGNLTNFYTIDEISHMNDVNLIFKAFFIVLFICIPLFILTLVLIRMTPKSAKKRRNLGIAFLIPPILIILLLVPVLVFIAIDWQATFEVFHEIFFPQGNWTFSPDSYMIRLLPDGLFFDGAVAIGTTWVIFLLATLVLGIVLIIPKKKPSFSEIVDNTEVL